METRLSKMELPMGSRQILLTFMFHERPLRSVNLSSLVSPSLFHFRFCAALQVPFQGENAFDLTA